MHIKKINYDVIRIQALIVDSLLMFYPPPPSTFQINVFINCKTTKTTSRIKMESHHLSSNNMLYRYADRNGSPLHKGVHANFSFQFTRVSGIFFFFCKVFAANHVFSDFVGFRKCGVGYTAIIYVYNSIVWKYVITFYLSHHELAFCVKPVYNCLEEPVDMLII